MKENIAQFHATINPFHPPTTMSESALTLAIQRNANSGNAATSVIIGQTRELLDALEKGDVFVWPDKAFVDVHFSKPPKQVTAAEDTDEWRQQWAKFLNDLESGTITAQQAVDDGFQPVYFMLLTLTNEPRKGKICKLYLKSLNKRVFEYTKDEDGNIVTTKRYITSGGNVGNLTQQYSEFADIHKLLVGKTIKVTAQNTVTTRKFRPKGSLRPDELTQGHTYDLHCDNL